MARSRGTEATGSLRSEVEERLLVFAEQMGRAIGTVQNRADDWLESAALQEQLTRVRDGATELLSDLSGRVTASAAAVRRGGRNAAGAKKRAKRTAPRGRSGGKVDAAGKKHRKPPASARGARHSDETIAKAKRARTIRAARG